MEATAEKIKDASGKEFDPSTLGQPVSRKKQEAPPIVKPTEEPTPTPETPAVEPTPAQPEVPATTPEPTPASAEPKPEAAPEPEITDKVFIDHFNKLNGTKYETIDDIKKLSKGEPTENEKKIQVQRERVEFLDFYSKNTDGGKVDDVVAFENLASKAPTDIVKESFAAMQRKNNRDITPEEIDAKFNKRYHINEDGDNTFDADDTREGEERITAEANHILGKAGDKILKAQKNYEASKQRAKEALNVTNKIESFLKEQGDKHNIKISDKESLPIEVTPEMKQTVQETMTQMGLNTPGIDVAKAYDLVFNGLFADKIAKAAHEKGISSATSRALQPFENPITGHAEPKSDIPAGWLKDASGKLYDPSTVGQRVKK